MKKMIAIAMLIATSSAYATQNNVDLAKMKREINIMKNILTESIAQDKDIGRLKIKAHYLMSQGITFQLDTQGIGSRHFDWASMLPRAAVSELHIDEAQIEAWTSEALSASKEAYQLALEVIAESGEKIRELAEKERDINYEIRTLEREKRDVDFERRHSESEDVSQLENRKKTLLAQIDGLIKQKDQLEKEQQSIRVKLKEDKALHREKAEQKKLKVLNKLRQSIAMTLCDYGAGLRSLPNNEKVNFIISAGSKNQPGIVYVFSKKDIKSCLVGDIDSKKLLASSINYQF